MSKQTKSTDTLADAITDIGHRIDKLVARGRDEGVWPTKIFDEDFVMRTLFPDGKSSPLLTLTLMTLRLEPMVRFLEENLVPELDDRASQKGKPEKEVASDASRANH